MNLRSSTYAPQKYDDLDFHDHNQDRVRERTPVKMTGQYCGPVVAYNPNLRPAIFPTIPLDHEADEDANVHVLSGQSGRTPQSPRPDDAILHSSTSAIGRSNPGPGSPSQSEFFDFASFRDPQMFLSTPNSGWAPHERSRSLIMTPPRSPSPTGDNGPGNKVYMENLEMMRKFGKMTEEDWNIAEMVTSDEEEPEEKPLAWDGLTIAHRLDLVDVVDEKYKDLEKTFRALRLTRKQRETTNQHLDERSTFIDARDDTMQKVQDRANEILLNGKKDEIDWLTMQGGYEKLMEDNVYQHLRKFDYHTSTVGEYRLAKQYLVYCGFKPELNNHWTSPTINDTKLTKPSLVANSNPVTAESLTHSEPKPRPALFPTLSSLESRPKSNPKPAEEAPGNALAGRLSSRAPSPAAQAPLPVPRSQADVRPSETDSTGPPSKRPVPIPFESQGHFKRYARARRPPPTSTDAPVGTGMSMIDPVLRQQSHTPPIANFPKPKPRSILKIGNRRHSTNSTGADDGEDVDSGRQVQANLTADKGHQRQSTNVFTGSDQTEQATSTNHNGFQRRASIARGSENLVMSSDDPRSQALRPPAYQVPPLARAFNLPPQLAQQQHSWLPDTASNTARRTSTGDRSSNLPRPRYDSHGVEIPPGLYSNGNINGNINGSINRDTNGYVNGNSALPHNYAHPGPIPSNGDPSAHSRGGKVFPDRQPTIQDFHNAQHSLIALDNFNIYSNGALINFNTRSNGNGNMQGPYRNPMPGNRGRAPPAPMLAPFANNPQRNLANFKANTLVTNDKAGGDGEHIPNCSDGS